MRPTIRRLAAGLTMVVVAAGCSVRAQQLRSMPLAHELSVQPEQQTDKRFVIYAFEDLRGGEYQRYYPTTFIPVASFFHMGAYFRYPEQAGLLRAEAQGRSIVTVGALDTALPYLLAELMRKMRFTTSVTPIEEVNTKVDLRSFDYVVTGQLKRTRMGSHVNLIPLAVLGILGVPYVFSFYELEYEVLLSRATDPGRTIFRKRYSFRDSRVIGLYYNHSAAHDMFVDGLERTLPEVVKDLAAACANQGGAISTPAVEPAAPPPPAPPRKSRPRR